jgi:hypothetical protein
VAVHETDDLASVIQQAGVILRAMTESLANSRPNEVTALSAEALALVLDIDPSIVDSLTVDGLVDNLSSDGDIDVKRARLAAEAYVRRVQAGVLRGEYDRTTPDMDKAARLIELVLAKRDGLEDGTAVTQLIEDLREARMVGGASE